MKRLTGYATPWRFNGKEYDQETGNYCYGARYYDPKLSIWLSVDPMSDQRPWLTPYNFVQNNPINLVDPTGMLDNEPIDITDNKGNFLFRVDDGKEEITTMTAKEAYDQGVQWFEPLADNYMPLMKVGSALFSNVARHFSSEEIEKFANEDRWMISYRQGGSGDWKDSDKGADGYFLVTVDGDPYWSDAIGQIPFAVDYVTDMMKDGFSKHDAIIETVIKGMEYGEGKPIGGKTDYSNTYDNYFILRGALYGTKSRRFTDPITPTEKWKYGRW